MDEARLARIEDDIAELKTALEILGSHCATQERMLRVEIEVPKLQTGFQKLDAELKGLLADYHALRDDFWAFRADLKDYPVRDELKALEQALNALHLELGKLRQRLDSELPYLAAKDELQKVMTKTRNWSIGTAITLFAALATMQFNMYLTVNTSLQSMNIAIESLRAAVMSLQLASRPQAPRSLAPPDCLRD